MHTQILTQTGTKVKGVFTKRLMKTLSVTLSSVVLLIGFVGSSSADEEDDFTVSMTSGDKTYYSDSGYITHTAKVETSHVFAEVDWYVNDVWQTTSKGDGAKKTASFTKGFSGNGYGRSYEIEAVAYSEDGRIASDSHRIRVKKNVVRYDGGSENDYGYAEITTCGWSGLTSSASMYAEVNNISDASVSAFYEFSYWVNRVEAVTHNSIDNGNLYTAELPAPVAVPVAAGSSDHAFYPDSHTITEGDLMEGEEAELGVKVTVDVWQGDESIGSWTASKKEYYTPPEDQ
jgi:hypothetical protein